MPRLGFTAREVLVVADDVVATYERVWRAVIKIGRVTAAEKPSLVRGRTRYGLNGVSLNVFLAQREAGGTELTVEAWGGDLLGSAARHGIQRLAEALSEDGRR